jgi:hypothetical protein
MHHSNKDNTTAEELHPFMRRWAQTHNKPSVPERRRLGDANQQSLEPVAARKRWPREKNTARKRDTSTRSRPSDGGVLALWDQQSGLNWGEPLVAWRHEINSRGLKPAGTRVRENLEQRHRKQNPLALTGWRTRSKKKRKDQDLPLELTDHETHAPMQQTETNNS